MPRKITWYREIQLEENGCWTWLAAQQNGYGMYWKGGKSTRAHRYVYTQLKGPIDPYKALHHTCQNKLCVNPWHLEPVTPQAHAVRHDRKWAFCKKGHELTPENAHIDPRGRQRCKICRKIYIREYKRKERQKALDN